MHTAIHEGKRYQLWYLLRQYVSTCGPWRLNERLSDLHALVCSNNGISPYDKNALSKATYAIMPKAVETPVRVIPYLQPIYEKQFRFETKGGQSQ